MSWRPLAGVELARARADLLRRVRSYFDDAGVLEVATPSLAPTTVTEPNIESLRVMTRGREWYLQTSPEYYMKRLLAAGYPDIWQASSCYRDGETGRRHLLEFTLVEWYRLGFDLDAVIGDTVALAGTMSPRLSAHAAVHLSYAGAFADALGIDALDTDARTVARALDADEGLCNSLGDDVDAWLDLALATVVAPAFATDRLTVLHHYPASQAALARRAPDAPGTAERFEVFYGDLELANGFVELTDAGEQRRRFEADRRKRHSAGLAVPAIDEALLDALASGLPPCAGVALGLDRVLMVDQGLDDIRDVVTFTAGGRDDD